MVKRWMLFDEPKLDAAEVGQSRIIETAAVRTKRTRAPPAPLPWWARKPAPVDRLQPVPATAAVIRWPGRMTLNTSLTD
jgi:hypothetical protein